MTKLTLESIFTPENIADPYPMYNQLRQSNPVLHLPDANMLVLTRYADVQAALKDKDLGHTEDPRLTEQELRERRANPAIANLQRTMLLQNPPDHTRLRGLVVKAFDARRCEAMRERICQIAHRLIDEFIADGSTDLVRAFTHPLPVIVICDLLGVPEADREGFIGGTRISGRLIDPSPMTREELDDANLRTLHSQTYFETLCDERRRVPQDDLITALVESETDHGKLDKGELTANIGLLFAAGHETTVNLIGNALLALFRNPEQLSLLRIALQNDDELLPRAVEEFLRYDSSVQLSGRGALRDTTVAGVQVCKGTQIITLLAAANRDPEIFSNPNVLDINRDGARPLSFGGGIHFCLGAQLARIEAAEALRALLQRLPNLELTNIESPQWKQTITLRGQQTLPARW